jgi:hypothetical protein
MQPEVITIGVKLTGIERFNKNIVVEPLLYFFS